MEFEVVDSIKFCYNDACEPWNMNREQVEKAKAEARKYRAGSDAFVRIADYWCPMLSEEKYEDVWSGEIKPVLGAPIECYGLVRGAHKPRDRKMALDALYEEYKKNSPPHPKGKMIGDSVRKAITGSVA